MEVVGGDVPGSQRNIWYRVPAECISKVLALTRVLTATHRGGSSWLACGA